MKLIPVVDGVLVIALIGSTILTAQGVLLTLFDDVEPFHVNEDLDESLEHLDASLRLGAPPEVVSRLADAMPDPVPSHTSSMESLYLASLAMRDNQRIRGEVASLAHAAWMAELERRIESTTAYWSSLAADQCVKNDSRFKPQSKLSSPADQVELVLHLRRIDEWGRMVVQPIYEDCIRPAIVNIGEDVLHFRVDSANTFEGDSAAGFGQIFDYVEEYRRTRPQIYVIGHTDPTAGDAYNDSLSFRRALYVAGRIRGHLQRQQLVEGRDFELFPVGRGEHQLLPQQEAESRTEHYRRCRRIELSFRSDRRGTDRVRPS